jgi:hypothetical protein
MGAWLRRQRIRATHHLGFSILRHCGLSLW